MASLRSILESTRSQLTALRARLTDLERQARSAPLPPPWADALRGGDVALIAEVKRRSPSAGEIASDLDPVRHARAYVAGGARAVSVLTEGPHFGGSLDDLGRVRLAVSVPILRKDFVVDPVQVYQTRACGASAVLLIARALPAAELEELAGLARALGLAVLLEVHRPAELDRALALRPDAIGVNSRDLETFLVDHTAAEDILREIPPDVLAVAESGLRTRADVERVADSGADAVLVGTALASVRDPQATVHGLVGVPRRPRGGGRL